MDSLQNGTVVICQTGQAGTVCDLSGKEAWVLLRNGDIWVGQTNRIRFPQDEADLDAAPIDVDRLESKRIIRVED